MANGRAVGRIEVALGIIGLAALATSYVMISGRNPLPAAGGAVTDWLSRAGSLSKPEAAWVQRLGDPPTAVTVAESAVVFMTSAGVEVRDAGDGRSLWSRDARWVAAAGEGSGTVVVLGKGRRDGYDVVDPRSGTLRWHDAGIAVWAYRDALLSLSCPAGKDCVVTRRRPADGGVLWSAPLRGDASGLTGAHGGATGLPPMLGFPVDNRIRVLDMATGAHLRDEELGSDARVIVQNGRTVRSIAVPRNGSCRYTVEVRDVVTGRIAWKKDGYDLGTASGADCEQRRDPLGGSRALAATRGDDRPALLSIVDGRELWVGAPGEKVLAVDGKGAVARAADGKSLILVDAGSGRLVWTRSTSGDVTLTEQAVVVTDAGAGRLVAYDRAGGSTLVDVSTQASVLGSGPIGIVLHQYRTVGVLPFRPSTR